MVHCDVRLAKQVINRNCLPLLLRDIERQNKYYKRAVLFVIRSLTGHNEEIASVVVSSGGLEALVLCLEDFEPMVKQGAVWAIGHIARHSLALAQNVVDIGAVPLVILCLQEPELTIKQVSVSAIADVAKHGVDLAQNVVDAGAVPHLVRNLGNQDEKLKRNVLHALSCIATHSNDLAEVVVEAEIFPSVLIHMSHACPVVRRNAASLVRDIVKHSLELTQLVVNTGGIGALMEALHHQSEESKVPCITAVGYIAGHSDQLAMSVLGCNGVDALTGILRASSDDATQAVTVWTLGQIGKHSPEHAKAIGIANAFPLLLNFYLANTSSEDLKYKCKTTLKQCLQKCIMLSALEPLLYVAPINILKYVLGQFSKLRGTENAYPPHPIRAPPTKFFVTFWRLDNVLEGVTERPEGASPIRHQRRTKEGSGNTGRARLEADGIHYDNQRVLPGGDRALLFAELSRNFTGCRGAVLAADHDDVAGDKATRQRRASGRLCGPGRSL
ncbi:sperm-associated antigen 6-like isoform X3 [Photinus pyralis]|uniref:sperm-associated antigen 6-like isoform X3 n=1 Tax=Photinus pyralis TaxID=7054 RepID=UPI001266F0B7|nr:sperm-associated antigen 6-like isoform X3 [Photinus pyralis]